MKVKYIPHSRIWGEDSHELGPKSTFFLQHFIFWSNVAHN